MISIRGIYCRAKLSNFLYRRRSSVTSLSSYSCTRPQIHQTASSLFQNTGQSREYHLSKCCLSDRLSEVSSPAPLSGSETGKVAENGESIQSDSFLPDHKFDHLVNPSNAYEIRKRDLIRYLQTDLSNRIDWILENHEESESIAERVEKIIEFKRYFTKEEILEHNEARLESRRIRREGKASDNEVDNMIQAESLDALNGVAAGGDWENVASTKKEGEVDGVEEEEILSELLGSTSANNVEISGEDSSSLLGLLNGDNDTGGYGTLGETSETIGTASVPIQSNNNNITGENRSPLDDGIDRYDTPGKAAEDIGTISAPSNANNMSVTNENSSSLLGLLNDNVSARDTLGTTPDSIEAALAPNQENENTQENSLLNLLGDSAKDADTVSDSNKEDSIRAITVNMNSSHVNGNSQKSTKAEKNRLLALFQEMNEESEKNNDVEVRSGNTSSQSEVSLMDLLADDLYRPGTNDSSNRGRGDIQGEPQRSGSGKKNLLQMLDDDFEEIFGNNRKTNVSSASTHSVSKDESYGSTSKNFVKGGGGESLLHLLSDDSGKRKQALSSTSLLDLLKEDGMTGKKENEVNPLFNSQGASTQGHSNREHAMKSSEESLLDMLDGEKARNSASTNLGQGKSQPNHASNSLLGLLEDDTLFDAPSPNSSNPQKDVASNSLLGLLEDDTLFDAPSPNSSNPQKDVDEDKYSLLALLDGDENSKIHSENKIGEEGGIDNTQSPGDSLLDLLSDDAIHATEVQKKKDTLDSDGDSLLSLLGDGEVTTSQPSNENRSLDSSDRDSLSSLLNEEDTIRKGSSSIADLQSSDRNALSSLLDEEDSIGEDSSDGNSHQDSLLNLLENEDATMGRSSLDKSAESSEQGALLSLLGDEEIRANENSDDEEHVHQNSMLDMLGDEDVNTDFEQGSLSGLLDSEDADESYELKDEWENDENLSSTIEDLLMKGKSLVSILKKDDWNLLDPISAETNTELDVKESQEDAVEFQDDVFVDELLLGSSMGKWNLTSEEFKMLLMQVATSTSPRKIEILLDLYLHAKELSESTRGVSILDSETYAILLGLLDKIPGGVLIAADIGGGLIDRMEKDLTSSKGKGGSEIAEVGEEFVEVAMRIQTRAMDVRKAEILMEWALSENGKGVRVSPMVFKMMLMLYQSNNDQEKALQLVETCIKENKNDPRGLDIFFMGAVNWPRRSRQGRKLAVGSYCEAMVKVLGELDESYSPSFYVWRKMLNFALYTAKESPGKWELVQRCCHALVNHEDMTEELMDDRLLQAGLEVADRMRDPLIATEIICKTGTDTYNRIDANDIQPSDDKYDWHPVEDEFEANSLTKTSPSSYIKAIKLCIECRQPILAEKILAHACRSNLPKTILSDIHALVLTGFAQNGDSEKSSHIFDQMKMAGLNLSDSTYAAYIHGLVAGGKHKEALAVLDSMLNGSNEDGVRPGISTFTACIVSAIKSGAFDDVTLIIEKMKGAGVKPNATIFQGIIIANARQGNKEGLMNAIETVIDAKTPIDVNSYLLCAKHLMPEISEASKMDVSAIRLALRKQVEDNPRVAEQAMALNRTLTDCLREDQRKPSKMKNEIMIQQLRANLWRRALQDTICLSKAL